MRRAAVTAEGWVLIIGAFFGGIVLCINTWAQHFSRKEARAAADEARESRNIASNKLDIIHDLTNSKMTALKDELAETKLQWQIALDRIGRLETLLTAATKRHDDPR